MSLGAAPLILMKKLQHKDISHLFFCGVTLVGLKKHDACCMYFPKQIA
jgi:hypothetical protein